MREITQTRADAWENSLKDLPEDCLSSLRLQAFKKWPRKKKKKS